MPLKFDALHGALALAVIGLVAALLRPRKESQNNDALKRIGELERELNSLKTAPKKIEYRIERYELLWFPVVTASPQSQEVLSVVCGLPHCRSCLRPLTVSRETGDWLCAECQQRYPASLSDTMVTDGIEKDAVKYFLDRNKSYRIAPKKKS